MRMCKNQCKIQAKTIEKFGCYVGSKNMLKLCYYWAFVDVVSTVCCTGNLCKNFPKVCFSVCEEVPDWSLECLFGRMYLNVSFTIKCLITFGRVGTALTADWANIAQGYSVQGSVAQCLTPVPTVPATPNQYILKRNTTSLKLDYTSDSKNISQCLTPVPTLSATPN